MRNESTRESRFDTATHSRREPATSRRILRWLHDEVVKAPLVPVLHPSPLRMKGLGLFTLVGHPLFWFAWTLWLPQPYESLWMRLFAASLGLLLIWGKVSGEPSSRFAGQVFTLVFWWTLPFLFSWMYFCNGGNAVWLASMAAMILIYYFTTDWRIATVGIASGMVLARMLFDVWGPPAPVISAEASAANSLVLFFCVSIGLLLGLSSANLRREHLAQTLTTMGIMAHELRTPLATIALVGDAVRGASSGCSEEQSARLDSLVTRLHMLVRNMNHQIDLQISNARLLQLPQSRESISAGQLVQRAAAEYPYRSARERESVQVSIESDFEFQGSQPLFSQVIDNLMKNAMRSLASAGEPLKPGDLRLIVRRSGTQGHIVVSDRGVGISPHVLMRIFEPFFSTNRGTGHGLGLAFCKRVVQSARGTIRATSEPGAGATFVVELPIHRATHSPSEHP